MAEEQKDPIVITSTKDVAIITILGPDYFNQPVEPMVPDNNQVEAGN